MLSTFFQIWLSNIWKVSWLKYYIANKSWQIYYYLREIVKIIYLDTFIKSKYQNNVAKTIGILRKLMQVRNEHNI